MRLVVFTINTTFWRGEHLEKGGHYALCPLSQSNLLHISVSLLVISVPSRLDGCSWLSGRNTAAPHRGSCPVAALPCPHGPWTCQAGAEAHSRTCHKFSYPSILFSSPPTVGPRARTVLLTMPVEKLRSGEDARHAGEDGSYWGAGSVPHQPAAWTGRQSPTPAGAKTRPHFTAKQSPFVQPVLPEQSSALTMSFLCLSPCRATSSVLSPTPGSLHQRLPTALLLHLGPPARAASAWDSVATSGQGKVFPGKSPAKPGALRRAFSCGFVRSTELHGAAAPHIRRAALGHSCGAWHVGVKSPNLTVIPTACWGWRSHLALPSCSLRLQAVWGRLPGLINSCGLYITEIK